MAAPLVLAECVYVLESFYELERRRNAETIRAAIALPLSPSPRLVVLLLSLELYEHERLDYAEAYLAASAALSRVGRVASFDHALRRISTIELVKP